MYTNEEAPCNLGDYRVCYLQFECEQILEITVIGIASYQYSYLHTLFIICKYVYVGE